MGNPIAWSLNFTMYLKALQIQKTNTISNCFFAGGIAGIAWSTVVCPFEMVKCYSQRYRVSSINAFKDISNYLGVKHIYRGYTASLMRDIPLSSTYFGILEINRRYMPQYNESTFLYPFLNGCMCGITAWMIGLPGDTIKSHIQTNFASIAMQEKHSKNEQIIIGNNVETQTSAHGSINISRINNTSNPIRVLNHIVENHGIVRGLFNSTLPIVLRGVITAGCCIVGVEYVNKKMYGGEPL